MNKFSIINRIMFFLFFSVCCTGCSVYAIEEEKALGNFLSPVAVQEVLTGKRKTANAAWWGFDKTDSTFALQSAINSGASKVIVPYMGDDWVVRPIQLASNQEIVFEKNVKIIARSNKKTNKPEFFINKYTSSLFTAKDKVNIILRGYGATFQMRKAEYKAFPKKLRGGSRHCIRLNGCNKVAILGLTLKESGGDGIMVAGGSKGSSCVGILIRDVNCDNNYRNAITVGTVNNLVIENCILQNTTGSERGGGPAAGIDFEPWNRQYDMLKNIVVRNCIIKNNGMFGIIINPSRINSATDINILIEDCIVSNNKRTGLYVSRIYDDGPDGLIKFKDVRVRGGLFGIRIRSKSAQKAAVIFEECVLTDIRTAKNAYPVNIYLPKKEAGKVTKPGGIKFIDCQVFDNVNRPAIKCTGVIKDLHTVLGSIYVKNDKRKAGLYDWGDARLHEVSLTTYPAVADFAKGFDIIKKYDDDKKDDQ